MGGPPEPPCTRCCLSVPSANAIVALRELLDTELERITRLWAKRLRAETYEVDIPGKDLRAPLRRLLTELARLLKDRGEDAIRLWPEVVRSHGAYRYEQNFEPEDLTREFKSLAEVIFYVYARRNGRLDSHVAELVSELVWEADASAQASYARVLKTEEVRFREAAVMESVLNHVDVGILLAEVDGTVSFVTPPVSRLMGVPMRAVVGARPVISMAPVLSQVNARHPSDEPFHAQDMPYLRALREHGPVRGVMMRVERPDGEEAALELSATPVWEEEGELAGVIQTFTDRTESVNKTKALESAHDELRRLQGQLLRRTRQQALGQLASGAAHALNNFLNVLRLRITLLQREYKPEHLEALDKTVRQIGELVARLQEFNVQRTEERLSDVPVDQTVREALELSRGELEQRDHPVHVELDLRGPGEVRADAGFFRELIVNLLLSARDRMEDGGTLHVSTRREGDAWLSLRIEDQGPPYEVDELARLFDPLRRDPGAPQLSLYLAVARAQVQRWGGELSAENSERGPGAAFVVRLPRVTEARAPTSAPAAEGETRPEPNRRFQQTRSVLVVDDDLDNARMMAEVLTEEGYDVQVAHSPAVALQLWDRRRFDAALLDAVMPEMSGWELAKALRERSPQALLAIVTGMDVRGQNRASLALVDAVFRKPIDVGALDDFLGRQGAPQPPDADPGLGGAEAPH
ncbi:hybrid sensor histidine kinase/response regulator [Corallococcus sp. H22C18031201]|uniref:hybrid sensor histidine kinase/response regulator n=1 Tax=Citreicoccus inhibens TaxID=2849499 RepID=UPI000E722C99|nr:response regulator [Citreicoccus inhibens]MBU8895415.1 response regulator [Citreicoccus inhibens]RJS22549.1 hybrid sensor histidine kinase/response regulator [Corallococcus sp. H22C18031201]